MRLNTVPIDGANNFHRDVKTHAIINTNSAEYDSYMRQKKIIEASKNEADANKKIIEKMNADIESLQRLIQQLINKE